MTRDERAMMCADIFGKVVNKIYPLLTKQHISSEGSRELERRFDEVVDKILAGNESLFDELRAIAQQWGLAVIVLDQESGPLPPVLNPEQMTEPVAIETPKQVNLFEKFQNCNQI